MAYKRLYSNEDTIETLVEVAQQDGWDIMVKDAFMIVEKFADYENMEDRINQTRLLISEVGYKITNKIRRSLDNIYK